MKMRSYTKFLVILVVIIALSLVGCEDDDPNPELPFSVQTMGTNEHGDVLVNQNFVAMYFFTSDMGEESNCTGGCANTWPPVTVDVTAMNIDEELNSAYFGTITRADNSTQLTYKGWPLYYFSPEADGDLEEEANITGDGLNNAFFVAKPDYTVMLGKKVVKEGEEPATFLVDSWGVSLYDFANDEENTSNCTGGCANAWPIFNVAETLHLPSALNASQFGSFERTDDLGTQQTYAGKPLYYFNADEEVRGNVNGHEANDVFFLVQPALN